MKKQNMDIHPTHICANDPNTRRGQCNVSATYIIFFGKIYYDFE